MKLTIGMASYKNYTEVWFTVQALRMFHDLTDVEILVVDNFGDNNLRNFVSSWGDGKVRYVEYKEGNGPAAAKHKVFEEAAGEWVIMIDSHVMLPPGTVARFLEWADAHPVCMDLLQGPLVYDNLRSTADAMNPIWSGGMWGQWRTQDVGVGADPYPIFMHGAGLMACRKDAWVGFNPNFRGFGGEEGYIHEKFRQAGRRVILLPFLRWVHLFKVDGAPYPLNYEDRIRNYVIGFTELGLDLQPVREHFGAEAVDKFSA